MTDHEWVPFFVGADVSAPLLMRTIDLPRSHGGISNAVLLVTAQGAVESFIDGQPVSQEILAPGWSSFEWRLRSRKYDVTDMVTPDRFVLGFQLFNGWYRTRLGPWENGGPPYGSQLGVAAKLVVSFEDGSCEIIETADDGAWLAHSSGTTKDSLYDGQSIDARTAPQMWWVDGAITTGWKRAASIGHSSVPVVASSAPPIVRHERIEPISFDHRSDGRILLDFGQNLVGFVRIEVTGTRGTVITVRHSEVLEHEELSTRPLRSARATDEYTLSGGLDVFEATATFHGFRYAEITGWPENCDPKRGGALTAVVVGSQLRRTGHFECSDVRLNQLHSNIVWSLRGNFLSIPSDCPQRDERLGWTGDIAVFAPTACFLFDTRDFLHDWLEDVRLEQAHLDYVPMTVPDILKRLEKHPFPDARNVAGWSDAVVWVPWALWMAHGSVTRLREAFPSMLAFIEGVEADLSADGTWSDGFQLGDWLDPDADPDFPERAKADPRVVASLVFFRSLGLVRETAAILGEASIVDQLNALIEKTRIGFCERFINRDRITSDCPTVYALALVSRILDEEQRRWAGDRLAQLQIENGYRLATGFLGTPFLLDALSLAGRSDVALSTLLQEELPGWMYPVLQGATTIWERWDSLLPDGRVNPGAMTSFNHYALGAVGDWIHKRIGGIEPLSPGYREFLIDITAPDHVSFARTSLVTDYGPISVEWARDRATRTLNVQVPPGTQAVVRLLGGSERRLGPGEHSLEERCPTS